MVFSRRPDARFNRGRISAISAGGTPSPIVSVSDPTDMPSIEAWFLMSASMTADQSAGGHIITPVGSPATSVLSLDGQTAYLLDGVDDYLRVDSLGPMMQNAYYRWLVCELVANASGAKELMGAYSSSSGTPRDQLRWHAKVAPGFPTDDTPAYFTQVRQGNTGAAANATTPNSANERATLVIEDVYTGTQRLLYCNKMLLATAAHVADPATLDRFVIGASFFSGVAAGFANMRVAEFGALSAVPSDAYRTAFWNGYLWPRWIDTDEEMLAYMTTSGQMGNANGGGWRQRAHLSRRADGVEDGYEYATNTDSTDYVIAAKHVRGSRIWEVKRTEFGPMGAFTGQTRTSTTEDDNHNYTSLVQLANGKLAIEGGFHGKLSRYAVGPSAGSIDLPAPVDGPWVPGATTEDMATYPTLTPLPNGNVRRTHRDGASGGGNHILTTVDSAGSASAFKTPVLAGLAVLPGYNCYLQRVSVHDMGGGNWREHYFGGWRETGVQATAHDKIYWCIDQNGDVWQDPDCTIPQTMPIDHDNCATVDVIGQDSGLGELLGATCDENGVPMAATGHCLAANATPHAWQYYVIRWNGSGWTKITFPVIVNALHDAANETSAQVLAKDGWIHLLWVSASDGVPYVMRTSTNDLGATFQTEAIYTGFGPFGALNTIGSGSATQDPDRFMHDDVISLHLSYTQGLDGPRARAGICEVTIADRTPQTLVGTGGFTPWAAYEEPCILGTRGVTQWTDTTGNGRHMAPVSPATLATQPIRSKRGAPGLWPSIQGDSASSNWRNLTLTAAHAAVGTTSFLWIVVFKLDSWVVNRVVVAGQSNSAVALRTITSSPQIGVFNGGTVSPLRNVTPGRWTFAAAYFNNSAANDRWWFGSENNISGGVSFGAGVALTSFGFFGTGVANGQSNSGVACAYFFSGLNSTDAGNCVAAYKAAIAAKYAATIPYSRNSLII